MSVSGLRERKKQQTRASLEQVALELFAQKGFAATTIDEIAAAADVSPRTLFRYFATKEDLVFGRADESLAQLLRCLDERPSAEPAVVAVREALLAFAPLFDGEVVAQQSELADSSPQLHRRALQIGEEWARAIAERLAVREGLDRPPPALLLLAVSTQTTILWSLRVWRERGAGRGTLTAVIREQLDGLAQLWAQGR